MRPCVSGGLWRRTGPSVAPFLRSRGPPKGPFVLERQGHCVLSFKEIGSYPLFQGTNLFFDLWPKIYLLPTGMCFRFSVRKSPLCFVYTLIDPLGEELPSSYFLEVCSGVQGRQLINVVLSIVNVFLSIIDDIAIKQPPRSG